MKERGIFKTIEALHGDAPYGKVLDAGTGPKSLGWLTKQATDSITAVTGAKSMVAIVRKWLGKWERPQDRMIVGNWANPKLLAGEKFDTVLAENLLGSIEGFAPYFQTELFARLRPLTGKRLYVVGLEPYVVEKPADEAGAFIWEIGRYRDACQMLSGGRPYREFPGEWVADHLKRSGFNPVGARRFSVNYTSDFVNGQIGLAKLHLEHMEDKALAQSLIAHGEELTARALAYIERNGTLSHGFVHVIAADPV